MALENISRDELVEYARAGSEEAKTKLILDNSPLIKSVIKRYKNKGVEYDDLYQLGCMGLLKAINNYDSSFNVKFSTYAVPLIAGEVKRFLRDDGYIKISRSLKSLAIQINRFIDSFQQDNSCSPSVSELAKHFNTEESEIIIAMECSKMPVSIYDNADDDETGKSRTILEKIPDDFSEEKLLDKIVLKDIINELCPRDKKIIILRYFRDKTQSEIARELNVSQVQISRLEIKILEQLKNKLNK